MKLIHESVVYSESRKGVARKRLVGRVRIWYTATVSAKPSLYSFQVFPANHFFHSLLDSPPFHHFASPFKIYPFVVLQLNVLSLFDNDRYWFNPVLLNDFLSDFFSEKKKSCPVYEIYLLNGINNESSNDDQRANKELSLN